MEVLAGLPLRHHHGMWEGIRTVHIALALALGVGLSPSLNLNSDLPYTLWAGI